MRDPAGLRAHLWTPKTESVTAFYGALRTLTSLVLPKFPRCASPPFLLSKGSRAHGFRGRPRGSFWTFSLK